MAIKKELEFAYSKKSDKFFTKNENIREIFVENIISIERGNCNIDVKLLKGYKGQAPFFSRNRIIGK